MKIYRLEYTSRTGGSMTALYVDGPAALRALRAKKCEARLLDPAGRELARVIRNDGHISDRRVRWVVV